VSCMYVAGHRFCIQFWIGPYSVAHAVNELWTSVAISRHAAAPFRPSKLMLACSCFDQNSSLASTSRERERERETTMHALFVANHSTSEGRVQEEMGRTALAAKDTVDRPNI